MGHTDFVGPDGKNWPSVTEVCDVISKPGLYPFYGEHGTEGAKRIMEEAGAIGTEFHDEIFHRLNGSKNPIQPSPQACLMVDEFFNSFIKPYQVVPVALEQKVINYAKRYHGSYDGIVQVTNMPLETKYGKPSTQLFTGPVLADWKSSNGIYDSHGIQLGGYAACDNNIPTTGLIVQVKRDTIQLKYKFFMGLNYYGEVFYNAREIYNYIHKQGQWEKQ